MITATNRAMWIMASPATAGGEETIPIKPPVEPCQGAGDMPGSAGDGVPLRLGLRVAVGLRDGGSDGAEVLANHDSSPARVAMWSAMNGNTTDPAASSHSGP